MSNLVRHLYCGIRIVVVQGSPKPLAGVRFPHPVQMEKTTP